jgi:hypothetical protein
MKRTQPPGSTTSSSTSTNDNNIKRWSVFWWVFLELKFFRIEVFKGIFN